MNSFCRLDFAPAGNSMWLFLPGVVNATENTGVKKAIDFRFLFAYIRPR